MKFNGVCIFSDVDGTLISNKNRFDVPVKNLEAIKYFTENGGKFTIASGRSWQRVEKLWRLCGANAPCVSINGNEIYDFTENKVLKQNFIENSVKIELLKLKDIFPFVTLGVYTPQNYCIINPVEENEKYIFNDDLTTYESSGIESKDWLKLNIICELEKLVGVMKFVSEQPYYKKSNFNKSVSYMCEVYNLNGTKGTGIKDVGDFLGDKAKIKVAIGDYENDIEMLKVADISFAPANACDEVKKTVKYNLKSSNNDGAVAECISILEGIL